MATVAIKKQTANDNAPRPIRAAVFGDVATARRALVDLQDAGFAADELTVVSDSARTQRQFSQYRSKRRAGSNSVAAVAIGAIGGLATGVLAAVAVLMLGTTEETALGARWMAAMIAPLVAIMGGFCGAMLARGGEDEMTNYFDQSLLPNQILVAAAGLDAADPRLTSAERVFAAVNAESLPLQEG